MKQRDERRQPATNIQQQHHQQTKNTQTVSALLAKNYLSLQKEQKGKKLFKI